MVRCISLAISPCWMPGANLYTRVRMKHSAAVEGLTVSHSAMALTKNLVLSRSNPAGSVSFASNSRGSGFSSTIDWLARTEQTEVYYVDKGRLSGPYDGLSGRCEN